MPPSTAILGWGSLIWDEDPRFDQHHGPWQPDGPSLALEFSRVSATRSNALTLVLDYNHGHQCTVAYALSRRQTVEEAVGDLQIREGTTLANIGVFSADGALTRAKESKALQSIRSWATDRKIDCVIWTDLSANFEEKSLAKKHFSVEAAVQHIQGLTTEGKLAAAEYVWRAPQFIHTSLRDRLQSEPWFAKPV